MIIGQYIILLAGFFYIILHHLLKIKHTNQAIKLCIFLTILHVFEEYLGNTNKYSLEGVVIDNIGPLIDSKVNPKLRKIDNDYLDNSIGDVLSGVISCVLIIIYWLYNKKLPYMYLFGVVVILGMLLQKAGMLYD